MIKNLTDTYEERQKAFEKYTGPVNRNTKRMMLDYNRYHEAHQIYDRITRNGEDVTGMNVLDFGCGVADYGIYFGRDNAMVSLIDIDEETLAFAKWRFAEEDIDLYNPEKRKFDLVIFGECLDHLDHPLDTIKKYVDEGTKYIFTSSYPYRSDSPDEGHWQHDHHPKTALEEQPAIRTILEENYDKVNFGGQKNLWIKKTIIKP